MGQCMKPPEPTPTPNPLVHKLELYYDVSDVVVGEGGFGEVRIATNKTTGQKVAAKIIKREKLKKEDDASIRQEVKIMQSLSHRNIVKCEDFFDENKDKYYIIMELVCGGELLERIVQKSAYDEKEARDVAKIILSAISYLHEQKICHRDLKPENLLMASKEDNADVKLADFGFATTIEGFTEKEFCGTPSYMAPEIFQAIPYGLPVDMWAFGVILYIILSGYPPFYCKGNSPRELFKLIAKGTFKFHSKYWDNVSEDAKDLIRNLLCVDMKKRFTAKQALEHKWLSVQDLVLEKNDLIESKHELHRFLIRRKFRKFFRTIVAVHRMKKLSIMHARTASQFMKASKEEQVSAAAPVEPAAPAAAPAPAAAASAPAAAPAPAPAPASE